MKRQLIGAILVTEGRILLVRPEAEARSFEGLWSLPAGEVGGSESPEQMLIRVLADTARLDVHISRAILVHEGASSTLSLFEASTANVPRTQNASSSAHAFFALDDLPQQLDLDSMLCIAKYCAITSKTGCHASAIIDRVFASVFYSYLAPHLRRFSLPDDVDIYKYVVLSTPFRKFKSVVPFLLSRCDIHKSHLFLIPEFCFAVWTLLDDCHDETHQRYGQPSAVLKFGRRASLIALFRSLHGISRLLSSELSSQSVTRIISALDQSAALLHQRGRNDLETDIDSYLHQSADRTEFLRASWVGVLEETGYDREKRDALYDIQERSSRIGQLINDYFDLDRGGLRDFDQKIASAHWLLLSRRVDESDSVLLRQLWSEASGCKEHYLALLEKYEIEKVLRHMIREALTQIIRRIEETNLDRDEQSILIAWQQMSFGHFYPELDSMGLLSPFLASVENLLIERERPI